MGTLYEGTKLSIDQIDDDGLVSFKKYLPGLFSDEVIRSAIVVFDFSVGFLLDSIEIFVKTVEKVSDEFSTVVLVVTCKHGLEFANAFFEQSGGEC